jgi:hypothetical protein
MISVLAMAFPVHDWQFWVVTLLALVALYAVARSLIPAGLWPKWLGSKRQKGKRATLTVSAKPHKP